MKGFRLGLGCCLLIFGAGCHRGEIPTFVSADAAKELDTKLQVVVNDELRKYTGEYLAPKLLSEAGERAPDLALGQKVYQQRCVQCHGVSGDGAGPVAKYMHPRPRDYRKGIFKFTSTPYGYRPLREDLVRTLKQGIRGTSMPSFALLPDKEIQALVDYVIALTRRGELEANLIATALDAEELDPEEVSGEIVPGVLNRWSQAEAAEVSPVTPQPKFNQEHVERGRQAFLTKGCSKCHGDDGRGQTKENRGNDAWGRPTRAADLTSGMLHGGRRPLDIYRRIFNGINGTPMPAFGGALKDEPDTIWDLTAYVLSVSDRRRQGEVPAPGPINPYDAVPAASAETAEAPSATETPAEPPQPTDATPPAPEEPAAEKPAPEKPAADPPTADKPDLPEPPATPDAVETPKTTDNS